ncbi:hypothetical protein V8C86DRAFT_3032066 [Haematococcus lacustris]
MTGLPPGTFTLDTNSSSQRRKAGGSTFQLNLSALMPPLNMEQGEFSPANQLPGLTEDFLLDSMSRPALSNFGGGQSRSGDSRASTAYASRHQAAEQRRRTRINERLEALRKLVPHAERSNTACFLEEVIKYILQLRDRNEKLEAALLSAKEGDADTGCAAEPASQAAAAQPRSAQRKSHKPRAEDSTPPALSSTLLQGSHGGHDSQGNTVQVCGGAEGHKSPQQQQQGGDDSAEGRAFPSPSH